MKLVNLGSQINSKLNLSIDLYWQSSCGKPSYDPVPLKEILWAVIINRNLIRVVEKYIVGCKNEAGTCEFDSTIEQIKKKTCSFNFICTCLTADKEIFKNLN